MALRWAAATFVETEKSYRKIIGHDQLWILKAHLDETPALLCPSALRPRTARGYLVLVHGGAPGGERIVYRLPPSLCSSSTVLFRTTASPPR
jgi:hypothetical protein